MRLCHIERQPTENIISEVLEQSNMATQTYVGSCAYVPMMAGRPSCIRLSALYQTLKITNILPILQPQRTQIIYVSTGRVSRGKKKNAPGIERTGEGIWLWSSSRTEGPKRLGRAPWHQRSSLPNHMYPPPPDRAEGVAAAQTRA